MYFQQAPTACTPFLQKVTASRLIVLDGIDPEEPVPDEEDWSSMMEGELDIVGEKDD